MNKRDSLLRDPLNKEVYDFVSKNYGCSSRDVAANFPEQDAYDIYLALRKLSGYATRPVCKRYKTTCWEAL